VVAGFGLRALWSKHDDCEPGGLLSKGFRMLSFPSSVRIFLALQPCDMRKSFDGLHALVEHALEDNVRSGALFVFSNKRRTLLKILYFDGNGLWILAKRLERGTFTWPQGDDEKIALSPRALALLLEGVDLTQTKAKKWYKC
jgi:transposase